MERLRTLAARAAATFPGRVVMKYAEDDGPNWATLIAWNALSAVLPITLALAAVLGFLLSGSGVRQQTISNLVLQFLPNDLGAQQQATQAINGVENKSGIFAIVALLGFLWIASNLFGAMEAAFDQAFGCPRRNLPHQKLMSLLMMAVYAVLAGIAVGSSALLSLHPMLPYAPRLGEGAAGTLLQFAIGSGSGVLLFGMLYRVVPNLHLSLRHVLPGALVAGVALEILTYLLPLYLRINQGINAYGRTFALIFFLLFFFFLLGTITMVGAEINAVILERSQPSRRGGDLGDHGDQGPPGH